jgi:tRNA 2-thiouridine synthesizing protein A
MSGPPIHADAEWDAADLGCGELVLELRRRLGRMRPGEILRLIALDPGAPADLPAWCRMTGQALVSEKHPVYHIRKER